MPIWNLGKDPFWQTTLLNEMSLDNWCEYVSQDGDVRNVMQVSRIAVFFVQGSKGRVHLYVPTRTHQGGVEQEQINDNADIRVELQSYISTVCHMLPVQRIVFVLQSTDMLYVALYNSSYLHQ